MSSLRALTFAMSTLIGPVADPVFGAAPRQVSGVRAGHQRLGRDASGVDAGAADQFALDHRDALPGCRQSTRQRRPGLPGANDDRVEMLCHRLAVSARIANPPKIATASSSRAIGRSWPSRAATNRWRAW